jgi:hypothetical protein
MLLLHFFGLAFSKLTPTPNNSTFIENSRDGINPSSIYVIQFQNIITNFCQKHCQKLKSFPVLFKLSLENQPVFNSFLNSFAFNLSNNSHPELTVGPDQKLISKAKKENYLNIAKASIEAISNEEMRQTANEFLDDLFSIPQEDFVELYKIRLVVELLLKVVLENEPRQSLLRFREVFDFCGVSVNSENLPVLSSLVADLMVLTQISFSLACSASRISSASGDEQRNNFMKEFSRLLYFFVDAGYVYQQSE